jgi:hypothetical protein
MKTDERGKPLSYRARPRFRDHDGQLRDVSATVHLVENPHSPAFLRGQEVAVTVVLVYTAITVAFGADVDAQAGAYATGILVMMVSGAVAVTISAIKRRQRRAGPAFVVLTLVLLYALAENIREKPDGIAISGLFIAGIIVVSLISRV